MEVIEEIEEDEDLVRTPPKHLKTYKNQKTVSRESSFSKDKKAKDVDNTGSLSNTKDRTALANDLNAIHTLLNMPEEEKINTMTVPTLKLEPDKHITNFSPK